MSAYSNNSLVKDLIKGNDSNSIPFVDYDQTDAESNNLGEISTNDNISTNINLLTNGNKTQILVNKDKPLLRRNSISLLQLYPILNVQNNDSIPENAEINQGIIGFNLECINISDDIESAKEVDENERNVRIIPQIKIENDFDNEDDDFLNKRKPVFPNKFRSKRRLSVAPLPSLKLNNKTMLANDFDNQSNQTSITSINSIASLLKEKMQAVPQMIKKKKRETKDYKIKIFVTILFFIISFLIGYSYVMYHQKILTKLYFESAKFSEKERFLRIFNENGKLVITGALATTIGNDKKPYDCLDDDMSDDGGICLEWNHLSRLYMNYENFDVHRCYTIKWQSLDDNIYPTDCYDLGIDKSHWFGGSITKNLDWPLNKADFNFSPLISGDSRIHQFGNAIKRYFINSLGVAILVDEKTPLQLSVNKTSQKLCLRAMNDDFAFVNHLTPLPELSYKICIAQDIKVLHQKMIQQHLWDGVTEAQKKLRNSLIEEPIWKIPLKNASFNESTIYSFSENVIAMGFMRLGHILLNEFWQENIGDFSLDKERFPTLKNTVDILHRRGFKITLSVQPFISTDSINFKDAVKKKLLIYERHSEKSIPALTRYKSSSSSGVLDITNNVSIPWLYKKLKAVINDYQIDSFYLDMGIAYNMPHYYQCFKSLSNPDEYGKIFSSSFKQMIDFIGISTASSVLRPPTFLSLPPLNSSWDGLRQLMVSVLTYGILGYPFLLPGPVGGDYYLPSGVNKMISFYSLEEPPLPSQELYIRWFQLVTFLPSIQFSYLPSAYKSEYVTEIARDLTAIRQKTVIPLIHKYLDQSMDDGLPLIRPLWMLDPNDPACLSIDDQFSIGDELIVAPILEEGKQSREVYLPQGVWKDGIDSSFRKGNRWLHSYRVPKEKPAYFIKLPDNTRF